MWLTLELLDMSLDVYKRQVQDRLIKNLSKGYKQRVGLAQAILGFPEIIILDEPTVGLDPKPVSYTHLLLRLPSPHTFHQMSLPDIPSFPCRK